MITRERKIVNYAGALRAIAISCLCQRGHTYIHTTYTLFTSRKGDIPIERDDKKQRNLESGRSDAIDQPPSPPLFQPHAILRVLSFAAIRSRFPRNSARNAFCRSLCFFFFSSFFPSSFSVQAHWHRHPRASGIGKLKEEASRKERWKREEYIKDGRTFSRRGIHAAAHFGMQFALYARQQFRYSACIRHVGISNVSANLW